MKFQFYCHINILFQELSFMMGCFNSITGRVVLAKQHLHFTPTTDAVFFFFFGKHEPAVFSVLFKYLFCNYFMCFSI